MIYNSLQEVDLGCKKIVFTPPNDDRKTSGNLVGTNIYDIYGKCVGVISDIFCDPITLHSEYIEITPFKSATREAYVFPFDRVQFRANGKIYLPIEEKQLISNIDYDYDYVMTVLRKDLVTYDRAIKLGYLDYATEEEELMIA